jgi:tRNA(Ile)-lysidine synthase
MNNRFIPHYFPTNGLIVVGVSGGPDSLCMLDVMHIATQKIKVAHFNHQLRPESGIETEFVSNLAARMDLPFTCGQADVRAYSQDHKLSIEESARILRYRFLFEQARMDGAVAVAVGHTADDQVETILMHFLRGAGLDGLKGMTRLTYLPEFDQEIPLTRPILHLWRHETEAYCRGHNLQPQYDSSNNDVSYFRNRLRLSLIPELEKYNPRFKMAVLRMAEALAGDQIILNEAIENSWKKSVLEAEANYIVFSTPAMKKFQPGLRRNLFRRAMAMLLPNLRNLDFNTLERASNFVGAENNQNQASQISQRADLIEGLSLYREGKNIILTTRPADQLPSRWPQIEEACELSLNGQVQLKNHFVLRASLLQAGNTQPNVQDNTDPNIAWLDADLTGDKLTVRTRQAGDAFSPLGMEQKTVKLQDFFVNIKLPRRARRGWPLVCAGEHIAWVPGFRLAHPFRVTSTTKRILKITLQSS